MSWSEFGLGVQDIRAELVAMAAVTVLHQGTVNSLDDRALRDLLFRPDQPLSTRYSTPGHSNTSISEFRVGATVWSAGASVMGTFGAA